MNSKYWLMVSLAFILIGILGYLVYYIHTNLEIIKSDPLLYGIKQHEFDSCTCQGFGVWHVNSTAIWQNTQQFPFLK